MALQFDGKSSGTTGPKTRSYISWDDEKDWNPKMEDVEASSREVEPRYDGKVDPVTDLKRRLSTWDPNLPDYKRESKTYDESISDDDVFSVKELEDSPYPEVELLYETTMKIYQQTQFGHGQLASSISLGPLVAQIIAWPLGHGWAKVMPRRQFSTFGIKWCLNPGPFNIKEHSIIVVMAGVAFYNQNFGILFQLMLTISTQSIGYGIAGMMRKFLVYPAAMIWPGNLVSVTLMSAMYETETKPDPTIFGGKIARYRWFAYVALAAFVYYFIPGFLAQFLSIFAFATWIAPNNVVVNQLFGGTSGLSLIPITFDWTQISGFIGSPLIPPWFAIANTMIGVIVFFIFGASALHYGGAWSSQFLPMSDSATYDNTGANYNVTRVITSDFTLDVEAYKAYSPLFLSTTFALSYGLSFAAISSLIVYTYLNHGKQIWHQTRNSTTEEPDVHMKMMSKYREAPTWWYMVLFVLMVALSLVTVLAFKTELTWWAFLLALGISFAFSLPIGIIQAITNTQIGLNVLTEFIFGYIQPGKPLALMIFKTYGYITMSQSLSFVSDMKFGHYMKIPPRTMFTAQVVATTLSCFIQVGVLNFALGNIKDVCTPHQEQHFTCPGGKVFFSASVIWGLIGPARIFSPGQIYSSLFIFFGVGVVATIAFYFAARKWPSSPIKFLMAPLIFGGASSIPPATPLNYLSWGIVGFIFQKVIRQRYFGWWSRLNYLTSSGLDLGLALSTLFIFFAFTLNGVEAPSWWGNNIVSKTLDAQDTAVQAVVADGQHFGPAVWS
ncbi:Sexual differentiation process protein isp4 [Lachnellula suecica]|uniref:Sexual differentiation process protein isp4 n=1 Tax=Lachnellula suecica TaxID=602035 RepID=A0A8T9CHG5_9HELO|nr:Sexual differentiation process protein isp4 [Lachnellula suecica]